MGLLYGYERSRGSHRDAVYCGNYGVHNGSPSIVFIPSVLQIRTNQRRVHVCEVALPLEKVDSCDAEQRFRNDRSIKAHSLKPKLDPRL